MPPPQSQSPSSPTVAAVVWHRPGHRYHTLRACGAKATVAAARPLARASGSGPRPYRHGRPLPPTTTAPPPSKVERCGRRCSTWYAAGARGGHGAGHEGPSPRMQKGAYKGRFKRACGVEPSAPPPSAARPAAAPLSRARRPPRRSRCTQPATVFHGTETPAAPTASTSFELTPGLVPPLPP